MWTALNLSKILQHPMMIGLLGLMFTGQGICFPYPHFMHHFLHHLRCNMSKAKFQVQVVISFPTLALDFTFLEFNFIFRMIEVINVIQMLPKVRFRSLMVWVLWRMFLAR